MVLSAAIVKKDKTLVAREPSHVGHAVRFEPTSACHAQSCESYAMPGQFVEMTRLRIEAGTK